MTVAFPNKTLLDRHTTDLDIVQEFRTFKSSLTEIFEKLKYICITADCWTIFHR